MSVQTIVKETETLSLKTESHKRDITVEHSSSSNLSSNDTLKTEENLHKEDDLNCAASYPQQTDTRNDRSMSHACNGSTRKRRNKNAQPGIIRSKPNPTAAPTTALESQPESIEADCPGESIPCCQHDDSTDHIPSADQSFSSMVSTSSEFLSSSASLQSLASIGTDQSEGGSGYVCVNSSTACPVLLASESLSGADCSDNGKEDFVILNTHDDEEEAIKFKRHLETDIDKGIRVQLFSCVGIGETPIESLKTLPSKFNFILVFVTDNLVDCLHTKFLNEILITYNLKNGLRNQVLPVWTTQKKQDIIELQVICGALDFWRFNTDQDKSIYFERVRKVIEYGRKNS